MDAHDVAVLAAGLAHVLTHDARFGPWMETQQARHNRGWAEFYNDCASIATQLSVARVKKGLEWAETIDFYETLDAVPYYFFENGYVDFHAIAAIIAHGCVGISR